jgi:ribose-phosphate pyrophosphokinase
MNVDVVLGEDEFSEKVSKEIKAKFVRIESYTFPDSEAKFTLKETELKNKNILLVVRANRLEPHINDSIMKIYFITKLLRELEVNEINLLLPYMFYSRQDKQFLPGETKSFSSIVDLYENLGISKIITVNSHLYGKQPPLQSFFKKIKVYDKSPAIIFADYLKTKNLKNPIVIGPGKGANTLIEELANLLDADFEGLEKERNHKTQSIMMKPPKSDLKNRDVIIYDDVAASGGTIAPPFELTSKYNPRRIFIALPHIITKEGIERLSNLKYSELIVSDSFISEEPKRFTELSLVSLISNYIKEL